MIVAEKLYQKFSNYTSKGEIDAFFLHFTENKVAKISVEDGKITSKSKFEDSFIGNYHLMWKNKTFSKGKISSFALNNFEEFVNNARINAYACTKSFYIPQRTIYPIVQTFSKPVSDFISIPEYFLKVADNFAELQAHLQTAKCKLEIILEDGTKYAYSNFELDDNYSYTLFNLNIYLDNKKICNLKTADLMSLDQFDFNFTYYGDLIVEYDRYITLKSQSKKLEKKNTNKIEPSKNDLVLINPIIFEKLINTQLISQITAKNIIFGLSTFTSEDILDKKVLFKGLNVIYDSSQKLKAGSYKFGKNGEKSGEKYIFKNGVLVTPLVDLFQYKKFGLAKSEISYQHYTNLIFPNLKSKKISEIYRSANFLELFLPKKLMNDLISYKNEFFLAKDNNGKFILVENKSDTTLKLDLFKLLLNKNTTLIKYDKFEYGVLVRFGDLI